MVDQQDPRVLGCHKGSGGWLKKSKLAVEERVVTTSSTAEDGSNNPDDSRSDVVDDGLDGVDFDGEGGKHKVLISGVLDDEEKKISGKKFQSGMRKRNMGERKRMWKGWCVNQRDFFL